MPSNGNTNQRGYGHRHQQLRRRYQRLVQAGEGYCWRCLANGVPPERAKIQPGEPWDLGHDDTDRDTYRGPEHVACNRATAGRHKQPRTHTNTPALKFFD